MAPETVSDEELHAYVDGVLPAGRRAAVESLLAQDPAAAVRVTAYRAQADTLHLLYDPVLREPLPDRLTPPAAKSTVAYLGRLAAALALLLIGGGAGWWLHGLVARSPVAEGQDLAFVAVRAHEVFTPEVRHPVEVGAEAEQHLVGWLSKRLKAPLKAPNLEPSGYKLVGGRLLSDATGPAALFMYEDERGRRLTLYVRRHDKHIGETAFRYALRDGIGVFYWVDSKLSYALAGELDKDSLLALCTVIYEQLDK